MGKKNKYKNNDGESGKKPEQPQQKQQQGNPAAGNQGGAPPAGPSGSQKSQQQPQRAPAPQQTGQSEKDQKQGASGGNQGGQQRGGSGPPQGGQAQQQGSWGGNQGGQQRGGSGPPQGGQAQQQGSWGGNQGGQQRGGSGPPQGVQAQQQGSWGGNQGGQQRGGSDQRQGGQAQQQGSWGGNQGGQQRGGSGTPQGGQAQQQGSWGGNQGGQQRGGSGPPQGGQAQQQGSWGGNQGGQQRGGSDQRQGGQAQQQGSWGGSQGGQQQQRGGYDQGRQQGGGPGPRQGGQGQQQGYGGGGQQQRGGQGSVQRSFQNLSISDEQVLPIQAKSCSGIVRGTLGRPGSLEVNYLKLDLKNMPNEAYHYDVAIDPERPKKFLRPAFEQCKREAFGGIEAAFDGNKSCYSVKRLPTPISRTVQVPDSGNRMKEFKVEIKETGDCVVDLNSLRNYQNESVSDKPMRAIQVVDVVLSGNNHERGIRVGRSFFRKPDRPFDLEGGFEAWTGLFQAAILGEQPFINVDIAHKSFPRKSSLIEYLGNQGIRLDQALDNWKFKDVERFLKGIDIQYEPPASFGATVKKYKVLGIGDPASKLRFKNDEGQELTVAQYFQSRKYSLKYPNLNCVKVGSTVRSIYLPMELCSIPEGQALNRKDEKRQVEKMIRFAATSTNVRKQKIMEILRYFNHNDSPIIRAFGIQIGSNFIKVPSRNLPAPYMEYLNGQTVTTSRGAWRMDRMQFLGCSKPQGGHKWGIIYEEGSRLSFKELDDFRNNVTRTSKDLTMNLQEKAEIMKYRDVHSMLMELAKEKYALVFVVLGRVSYAKVKQAAELKVGILTQCIKEATVIRTARDRTVFSNILLKVNGKLNGTNHKISQDRDPKLMQLMTPIKKVMYLGADVTHPSPDQRHIPSVVGVAASHDLFGACYNMQYRLQRSTREDIEDMESIVTRHLQVYYKYQKSYPDQIIYYRDGVSDGQFPIIKSVEIRAIKSACAKLKCNPKMTCVIVVKRHHTRFFPMTQPRDDRDFNNVEPGTVVDQHIAHPNEVQFFMVSHQSIQGTAKPTRYNVIVDESKLDINLLQKLTYNLCHLFPRCNRVVSYPAPAYLAHLVAFRGRVYLEGSFTFSPNLKSEYEKRLIKPNFMETNPMYFI